MPPDGRRKTDQKAMKEIIHSGHFMVSDIDDPVQDCEDVPTMQVAHDSDCDQESLPLPSPKGFDFELASKETSKTYTFGSFSNHSLSIDASLTKLFECMSLAYSGKLTSPRWKQFKGLKLRLKEKIRLNNMIWRAWHMQFIMKLKTDKLCQFATPLEGEAHTKPEAVVIEGTYWKRRLANIATEYKKWRLFYRDRFRTNPYNESDNMETEWGLWQKEPLSGLQSALEEDFLMDFSDTLFTSFNPSQPFDFPNPKEIAAKAGIADFIQPGLVQLQPPLDDFMDTLEPLTDLFSDFLNSKLPTLPEDIPYTGGSLQNLFQSTPDQQYSFENSNNKTSSGRSSMGNVFSQFSRKGGTSSRKPPAPSKPQPSFPPQAFLGKPFLQSLEPTVPLPNSQAVPEVPSPLSFLSGLSTSRDSIETLLQEEMCNLQNELQRKSLQQLSVKQEEAVSTQFRAGPFYQQPTFGSRPFEDHIAGVTQPSLHTILQGQVTEAALSTSPTSSSNRQPLFLSLSLGQAPSPSAGNSRIQPQVLNIGYQQTKANSEAGRRHSYTTGQQVQPSGGDFMSSRRSRPIAPATGFAVPELPRRTRSRSVSSPQSGSPKPFPRGTLQAVSLTDISLPVTQRLVVQERPIAAAPPPPLQQSTLIAQLLAPGRDLPPALLKVSGTTTTVATSSPVTIIRPIFTSPFVFSPVTTASSTDDLQRNFIQSSSPVLIKRDSPPSCVLSTPDSPGSSTCSSSPAISTASFDSSPASKSVRPKSDEEKIQYREHRRVCHINAEQKRRCNIKNGFEQLLSLLPEVAPTTNAKISKASMLQRGAEHIRTLKSDREKQQEEVDLLKKQIEELNQTISMYQSQLPPTGAPVPCQRANRMKEMFKDYVREQTMQNWKFYIYSLIMESLVDSFNSNVSNASMEDMCKSIMTWLDQHCSLMNLRPKVLNSLRQLSTTTSILSEPSKLPEEALQAVTPEESGSARK